MGNKRETVANHPRRGYPLLVFTGIVETMAAIRSAGGGTLTVERPSFFDDITIGSSIAVNGTCLTVIELDDKTMKFDLTEETLRRTTLGTKKVGEKMNLERSVRHGQRMEGHTVQGHVEGTAEVKGATMNVDGSVTITLSLPPELMPCVLSKGSIAIDGVSLTVASIEHNNCSIALIPHTLKVTTLGSLTKGMQVNVETDILVRSALRR